MLRPASLLALSALTVACTTTQSVSIPELRSVSRGAHDSALVLRATDGTTVRIDPNTSFRFTTEDGTETEWLAARALQVGSRGVFIERGSETRRIAWEDITAIDARNLSGSKSLALVIGSGAVVAAIVALAASKSSPRLTTPVVYTGTRVAIIAAQAADVDDSVEQDAPPSAHEPAPIENVRTPEDAATAQLFQGKIRRRSSVELVPAFAGFGRLSAGTLSGADPLRYAASASIVARFAEMAELGFGVAYHQAVMQHEDERRTRESQLTGFLRAGATFYLDDTHRVGVPVLIDVGFGSDVAIETRIALGLRFRVFDSFMLGLYPAIPTYTRYRAPERYGDARWTVPSAIETSFAF